MPKTRLLLPIIAVLMLAGLVLTPFLNTQAATSFVDPAFAATWSRVDQPVENLTTPGRGYTWGPAAPGSESTNSESYGGGTRKVQYFDKARMEINNPGGNSSDLFYVTTGLLVKELVTGQRQDSDNTFTSLGPSLVQVAGDPNANGANAVAPTYASFRNVVTFSPGQNTSNQATGSIISAKLDRSGSVSTITPPEQRLLNGYDQVTGHNIADVFVDYGNLSGTIWDGKNYVQGSVFFGNSTYVLGRPVTEPYWTRAVVAGKEQDVLVQLFERRVLTYTPANPDGFKVEMGNVGQHYFKWRYFEHNGVTTTPTTTTQPAPASMDDFSQLMAQYNSSGTIPTGGKRNTFERKTTAYGNASFALDTTNKLVIVGAQTEGVLALTMDDPGIRAWTFTPADAVTNFDATPTVFNGVAYIGSTTGKVYAINTKDGSLKWISKQTEDNQRVSGAPVVSGNQVFFGALDGHEYAVSADSGQLLWKSEDLGGMLVAGTVIGKHGDIFVSTAPKSSKSVAAPPGQLYALKMADGTRDSEWSVPTLNGNIIARPTYANNAIYVTTDTGWIYDIRIDGKIRFAHAFTGEHINTTPAYYKGRVYIGTDAGNVYGLTADNVSGNIKWQVKVGAAVNSSPAVVDGYVYFGADDNQVYQASVDDDSFLLPLLHNQPAHHIFDTNSPIVYDGNVYIQDNGQRIYVIS